MSIFTTLRTSSETTLNEWLAALDSHIARVSQAAQSHKNPSPLRADGFDITTQEPVVWKFPDGHDAPIANFASQQNWLRTLSAMESVKNFV